MRWEYFSGRRRISLEKFVEDAKTLEEALAIFKNCRVSPPGDGSLSLLFKKSNPSPVVKKKEVKKSTSPSSKIGVRKSKEANNAKRKEISA